MQNHHIMNKRDYCVHEAVDPSNGSPLACSQSSTPLFNLVSVQTISQLQHQARKI
jgi:hypothetical protein